MPPMSGIGASFPGSFLTAIATCRWDRLQCSSDRRQTPEQQLRVPPPHPTHRLDHAFFPPCCYVCFELSIECCPGRCGSSGPPLGDFQQTFCLAARSRIEEKLSERLCQNGLELRHDGLDVRRDHMSIERSLVLPAFERQEAARLANDFHQRVDQTPPVT